VCFGFLFCWQVAQRIQLVGRKERRVWSVGGGKYNGRIVKGLDD